MILFRFCTSHQYSLKALIIGRAKNLGARASYAYLVQITISFKFSTIVGDMTSGVASQIPEETSATPGSSFSSALA